MERINTGIQRVLKSHRIFTRTTGSPGIWLSLLLPTAIIVGCLRSSYVSDSYVAASIYAFNTLLNAIFFIVHLYKFKSIKVTNKLNLLCALPMSITIYAFNHFLNMELRRSLCYTVANALIYYEGLPFLLIVFPNTFTFGEVNIAIQGLSLFAFCLFLTLNSILVDGIPNSELEMSSTILLLALSWIVVFCLVPYINKIFRRVEFVYLWGVSVMGMIYMSVYYTLDCNIFEWMYLFLTKSERIIMLTIWLLLTAVAVFIVQHHININKKSNTAVRKYFHLLIVCVFLPGVLADKNLLYFSSGCVLGLFMVLELFRILNVPPLNTFLKAGFSIYCDEKDSGSLALTPICLLIGHALPLWLHPHKVASKEVYLPLLSGVLSVGVGDTCASVGGKYFGKYKWKGSIKTIEGTLFCIFSQVIFILVLVWLGFVTLTNEAFIKSIAAITVTSLVEAKTDQIDNIVLPLTMYTLLML